MVNWLIKEAGYVKGIEYSTSEFLKIEKSNRTEAEKKKQYQKLYAEYKDSYTRYLKAAK